MVWDCWFLECSLDFRSHTDLIILLLIIINLGSLSNRWKGGNSFLSEPAFFENETEQGTHSRLLLILRDPKMLVHFSFTDNNLGQTESSSTKNSASWGFPTKQRRCSFLAHSFIVPVISAIGYRTEFRLFSIHFVSAATFPSTTEWKWTQTRLTPFDFCVLMDAWLSE